MSEGFFTNLKTAETFFRVCRMFHVTDLKERIALIRKITARGKAKYLRDVDPFLAGKKILEIKPKAQKDKPNES